MCVCVCVFIQKSHFSKYPTHFFRFFTIKKNKADMITHTRNTTESSTLTMNDEVIFSMYGNNMSLYYQKIRTKIEPFYDTEGTICENRRDNLRKSYKYPA